MYNVSISGYIVFLLNIADKLIIIAPVASVVMPIKLQKVLIVNFNKTAIFLVFSKSYVDHRMACIANLIDISDLESCNVCTKHFCCVAGFNSFL